MTARRTPGPGMVLPPHERAGGEIEGEHWTDIRVPAPLRQRFDDYHSEIREPRVLGHHLRAEECPDGRHLFDVIESMIEREVEEPDGEGGLRCRYEVDFRARLTCVRCGTVLAWTGTRDGSEHVGRVDPQPLAVGDLVAQQTSPDRGAFGARDMSSWTIYRAGHQVGLITWASGPRGRAFFTGRLDAWPPGEHVEGPDPLGVLRRVAKHDARLGAGCEGGR